MQNLSVEWQTARDICWLLHLPLFTFRLPFAVSFPKTFSASQLYSPASSSFTLLNCSLEIFLLKSTADISYSIADQPHRVITIPGPWTLPGGHPCVTDGLPDLAGRVGFGQVPSQGLLGEHLPLNPWFGGTPALVHTESPVRG